jgi:hypothetical protein
MVALAEEDWRRLINYKRTGTTLGPGPLRRAFDRRDPEVGWSARDLHECLARFWHVVAAGPKRVIEEEWASGRATALADVREAHRRLRAASASPEGAWDGADLIFALVMVAGEYASRFLSISGNELEHATFLFPWLAHFALQTTDPARTFDRFVREIGPALAHRVTDLLSDPSIAPNDLLEATMNRVFYSASVACVANAADADDPIRLAARVFADSSLAVHPIYKWAFRGPVMRTAAALAQTELAETAGRIWNWPPETSPLVGLELLGRALATPGLPESRTLLLAAGVVPPCVRYADGALTALPPVFRDDVASWRDDWHTVEILWKVTRPAREFDLSAEEASLTMRCTEIQRRWETFSTATRS